MRRVGARVVVVVALVLAAVPAGAPAAVPTTFPGDFPVVEDASLGVPILGFGASGEVSRPPVMLVHGNNDTPYPTPCNSSYGHMHALAEHLHATGHRLSELWAIGWQGDQCDLQANPTARSGEAHTVAANVGELRAFAQAVLAYTGAERLDVVAHSLGAPLVREWLRRDGAYARVRRVVSIDGTNHGIISCSPDPLNYYALPALGGFAPDSPVCREVGSVRTELMRALNDGDETPGPTSWTTINNADTSFVYFSEFDGVFPPVPAEDRDGRPHDFSRSAWLEGARNVGLTGQARYASPVIGTAHTGIAASPETFALVEETLAAPEAEPARAAPDGLRLRARRRGDRLRVRGRLLAPAGVQREAACTGRVRLVIRTRGRDGRRLALRRPRLDEACRFAARVRVPEGARRLVVRARFTGNERLRPAGARARPRG